MRIFVSLLLVAGLSVSAGEFVDKAVGLKMNVPDGWERDEAREKGSVKFAASLSVDRDKYVTLTVEAVPADGFSADDWLSNEKKFKASRYIAEVATKFTSDQDTRVGGLDAVGYVFGGKAKDRDGTVHFKVYGIVHGEIFFQITESSFNGAHNKVSDQLKEIWDGIMFQEGEGDDEDAGSRVDAPPVKPAEGSETPAVDKPGNCKTTLPPGWVIRAAAPDNKDKQRRMRFSRLVDGRAVVIFEVWKVALANASTFATGTPDDVLQNVFHKNGKFFEALYGKGSADVIHPQMDEGVGFGGAPKAGAYELRGITTDEMVRIAAAEQKVKKGIKGVKVPEFKPMVVRGRLAMLSPNVYLTRAWIPDRSLNEDPQLVAEIQKIHESFELLSMKAIPPPLEVMGRKVGNTVADPAFAKVRKDAVALEAQAYKRYLIEYEVTLPKGFVLIKEGFGTPTSYAMIVYAQDGANNWVQIIITNSNAKKVSEEGKRLRSPEGEAETWRSNWSAKARGTKVPKKVQKFSLGKIRGKGFRDMVGKVDGFPGTFTGIVSDKFPGKSWRTRVSVETRGDATVWTEALKAFFRKIKAKDIKVKK